MRLIDADALKRECRDYIQNYETRYDDYGIGKCGGMTQAMNEIDYAPTIDAIPVEWLKGLMLTTGDDVDKVEFAWIMRKWQEEQEAR